MQVTKVKQRRSQRRATQAFRKGINTGELLFGVEGQAVDFCLAVYWPAIC